MSGCGNRTLDEARRRRKRRSGIQKWAAALNSKYEECMCQGNWKVKTSIAMGEGRGDPRLICFEAVCTIKRLLPASLGGKLWKPEQTIKSRPIAMLARGRGWAGPFKIPIRLLAHPLACWSRTIWNALRKERGRDRGCVGIQPKHGMATKTAQHLEQWTNPRQAGGLHGRVSVRPWLAKELAKPELSSEMRNCLA